jgi:hypothetical protein
MPVTIDWGDGSPVETMTLNADQYFYYDPAWQQELNWYRFPHRYLNNPPGGSSYTIKVTATDNDTGNHTATTPVTVENVAPTIVLHPIPDIFEGDSFVVSGTVSDPGVLDTLTLTLQADVNWDSDTDDDEKPANEMSPPVPSVSPSGRSSMMGKTYSTALVTHFLTIPMRTF